MGRILQIAKQCQLLTGSYDGATHSCDCSCSQDCHLTEQQRLEHKQLPDVVAAHNRNFQEFNNMDKNHDSRHQRIDEEVQQWQKEGF